MHEICLNFIIESKEKYYTGCFILNKPVGISFGITGRGSILDELPPSISVWAINLDKNGKNSLVK